MKLRTLLMLALLLAPATGARAVPVLWTLDDNWLFTDVGEASGSFVFDADTGVYSAVSIVTTSGNSFGGASYSATNPNHPGPTHSILQVVTQGAGPYDGLPSLIVQWAAGLTNAGGTIATQPSRFELLCTDATCSLPGNPLRSLTSSATITGVVVPEPAFLVLALLGGVAVRARRAGLC